jgi:Stress responsive A/B Barrel Domain.
MLKHVVMWKFKDFAEGQSRMENAIWMKQHLEMLAGKIPELRSVEVGVNVKESEMAYDAVLIATFDSCEDLEAYKENPLHKEVSSYCKKVREKRVVCDYWF